MPEIVSNIEVIIYSLLDLYCNNMNKEKSPEKTKKNEKVKWINPLRDRRRIVPFVVPNQQDQLMALGSLAGEKWRIKKSLQAILSDFDPVKKPEPGDNLYEYEEDGQTFPLFASMYRNHCDKDEEIIYIASFHCKLSEDMMKQFKTQTKAFFYGMKVKLHKFDSHHKKDLAQFNPLVSEKGDTYYDAAMINTYFAKNLPKKCYSIAVVTDLLLYNGDNPIGGLQQKWIFGLGSIKDRTSIISYSEIIKKGIEYALTPQTIQKQYEQDFNTQFLQKVINHQLCHTFGMKHCIYYTCLMNGSNGYHEASTKDQNLCPVCLRKLQYAIDFDFVQRFQKLESLGNQKCGVLAGKIRDALGGTQ